MVKLDFGNADLGIASFPNCIFRASQEALEAMLRITGGTAGVWGEPPPLSEDGSEYKAKEWPVVDDFAIWALPANQDYAVRRGWGIPAFYGNLTMIVDSRTDKGLLRIMSSASTWNAHSDWYEDFSKLKDWIEELGWAYVNLSLSDLDHAFFVVARSKARWVSEFQSWLFSRGLKSAKLRSENGKVSWDGPEVL